MGRKLLDKFFKVSQQSTRQTMKEIQKQLHQDHLERHQDNLERHQDHLERHQDHLERHQDHVETRKLLQQVIRHVGHLVNRPESNPTHINYPKHVQIGPNNRIQSRNKSKVSCKTSIRKIGPKGTDDDNITDQAGIHITTTSSISSSSSSEDVSYSEDDLMSDTEYDVTSEKQIIPADGADCHYYKGLAPSPLDGSAVTEEEPYQNLPLTTNKGPQPLPLTGTDKTPKQNFSTDHDDTYMGFDLAPSTLDGSAVMEEDPYRILPSTTDKDLQALSLTRNEKTPQQNFSTDDDEIYDDFDNDEFYEQSTRNKLHLRNQDTSEYDMKQCSLGDTITDKNVYVNVNGYGPISQWCSLSRNEAESKINRRQILETLSYEDVGDESQYANTDEVEQMFYGDDDIYQNVEQLLSADKKVRANLSLHGSAFTKPPIPCLTESRKKPLQRFLARFKTKPSKVVTG